MTEALLPDKPPIQAGPIIVDSWVRFDEDRFPGEHIDYPTFVIEALANKLNQADASMAMRLAVEGLIAHLDLPILPPHKEREGDEPWGPYGLSDYYIDVHGYAGNSEAITAYAANRTDNESVRTVLEGVGLFAIDAVRHDTDRIPLKKLPASFYTPQYPEKRIKSGRVISFRDFQYAAVPASTSSAKAAAVFDQLIELLGDEEAKEHIRKLEYMANPYSRRDIRHTAYIKTQALASFMDTYPSLPDDQRKLFNEKALMLIRGILYDEDAIVISHPIDELDT
ncbi:MAG: hypothetical protein WDN66_02550 [Candidatus Saccharibacteria bacterium]